METIFSSPYIQVEKEGGKYYALFDSGELASKIIRQEITAEEALEVQKGEDEAYKILIKYDNQRMGLA